MPQGNLYVVATPIGNMADITFRAVEVMRQVALILSEDTRETGKILAKFELSGKPQISYRDQNHDRILPRILDTLSAGQDIALMSDSGTPLISDPGYKLVRDLITNGVNVVSIPGPSAVISSLVVSGLPTDKFTFLGFLPKGGGARKTLLQTYGNLEATLVIYESPFRVKKLLEEIQEALGDRKICLASELTKLHEKIFRGSVKDAILNTAAQAPKGEYVVLIGKKDL